MYEWWVHGTTHTKHWHKFLWSRIQSVPPIWVQRDVSDGGTFQSTALGALDEVAPKYQQKGGMLMAATIVEKATTLPGIAVGDLDNDADLDRCVKNYITKRLSISCLRGVAVLLKDRFDMPGSIGVEGKQQKKSKNYTKNALRVADKAMIEGACIHREARR